MQKYNHNNKNDKKKKVLKISKQIKNDMVG